MQCPLELEQLTDRMQVFEGTSGIDVKKVSIHRL